MNEKITKIQETLDSLQKQGRTSASDPGLIAGICFFDTTTETPKNGVVEVRHQNIVVGDEDALLEMVQRVMDDHDFIRELLTNAVQTFSEYKQKKKS